MVTLWLFFMSTEGIKHCIHCGLHQEHIIILELGPCFNFTGNYN